MKRITADSTTLAKINKELRLNQDSSRGASGSTQLKRRLNRPLSSTVHRVSIPNSDLNHNLIDNQIYEDLNDEEDVILN